MYLRRVKELREDSDTPQKVIAEYLGGEQFTVCSILPYHALLSHISHEIQNFFTHFAFILFYLVIVKCGKICGNTLKPQIGFVVCVHLIYYTHQYHPCQIETISKKRVKMLLIRVTKRKALLLLFFYRKTEVKSP